MSLVAAVQLQVTREMRPIACSVQSLQKMIGIGQSVILQQPADYGVYEWSRVVLEPLTEAYVMQKDWTSFHGALGMYFADGSHVRVSAQPNSSEYMVVYEYDARLGMTLDAVDIRPRHEKSPPASSANRPNFRKQHFGGEPLNSPFGAWYSQGLIGCAREVAVGFCRTDAPRLDGPPC